MHSITRARATSKSKLSTITVTFACGFATIAVAGTTSTAPCAPRASTIDGRRAIAFCGPATVTVQIASHSYRFQHGLCDLSRTTDGLELNVGDERVLKEIALFADRCDISEELTRLRSHFEQFTALLKSDGEIGRKSEFLLQEISREVHTVGSKANDLEISRAVIELKNELERVREQIANVE